MQPLLVAGLRLTGFRTLRIRKEHIVSDRAARADDTTVAGTTFRPSISVVIPALNEQKTLRKTVIWTHEVLASQTDDHEIIIVDDGSSDDTGAIADALSAELPSVRVVPAGMAAFSIRVSVRPPRTSSRLSPRTASFCPLTYLNS